MMTSPKEEWRQQISDYDILFIKGGWLVDKSNRPLPFVNQENREGGVIPPHHDYEGQKYPMTNRVNSILLAFITGVCSEIPCPIVSHFAETSYLNIIAIQLTGCQMMRDLCVGNLETNY